MDQQQIRRQPTNRPTQHQDSSIPVLNPSEAYLDDPSRAFEAIDDMIRSLLGSTVASDELIGTSDLSTSVRRATTSEEFVRNFRQHGGQ